MIDYPEIGTTNLHLDCGDAVNVLVNVTCPKNVDEEEFYNSNENNQTLFLFLYFKSWV